MSDDNDGDDKGGTVIGGTVIQLRLLDDKRPTTADEAVPADNVVSATFGQETTVKEKWENRYCRHLNIELDTATRTMECTVCHKPVDPFDRLLEYARHERDYIHAQQKEREVMARIRELEEEEKRVKARTRNASRKDAEVAVEAERKLRREKHARTLANAGLIVQLAERIQRAMLDKPEADLLPVDTSVLDD